VAASSSGNNTDVLAHPVFLLSTHATHSYLSHSSCRVVHMTNSHISAQHLAWSTIGRSEQLMHRCHHVLPSAAADWCRPVAGGRGQHGLAWLSVRNVRDAAGSSASRLLWCDPPPAGNYINVTTLQLLSTKQSLLTTDFYLNLHFLLHFMSFVMPDHTRLCRPATKYFLDYWILEPSSVACDSDCTALTFMHNWTKLHSIL